MDLKDTLQYLINQTKDDAKLLNPEKQIRLSILNCLINQHNQDDFLETNFRCKEFQLSNYESWIQVLKSILDEKMKDYKFTFIFTNPRKIENCIRVHFKLVRQ